VTIVPDREMGENIQNVVDLFEEALRDSGIVCWNCKQTFIVEEQPEEKKE
jgi:hypothetical protein